jgi:hypothetical protein
MILGMLWYSKFLFQKAWMELSGMNEKNVKKTPKEEMMKMYLSSILVGSLLSFMLYFVYRTNNYFSSLELIFIQVGLVLSAPLPSYLFTKRSVYLWLIDMGYPAVFITLFNLYLLFVVG